MWIGKGDSEGDIFIEMSDVADVASVDKAVEKNPVTMRMPVRTIQRVSRRSLSLNSRAWARPRA